MSHHAVIFFAVILLAGCATTGPSAPMTAESARAAELADLLVRTASERPDRIRSADAEMAALQRALLAATPMASQAITSPAAEMALAAAPDLTGARSLLSAVHLASYRNLQNAEAGWRELQAEAPGVLAGLEARLAQADLGERGVFLRLKAGPLDSPDAAAALCARLEAAGQWCAPVDFAGQPLDSREY
jgi:hypothetical protein